jgi:tetratricopeptide (TPR) repeat protein
MTIHMTIQSLRGNRSARLAAVVVLFFSMGLFRAGVRAAQGQAQQTPPPKNGAPASGTSAAPAAPAAPAVDPQEEAAYKAFFDVSPQDVDKKVQMGEDFVAKYPASRYDGAVYSSLVQLYVPKQDWDKFYAAADKALALNPDDSSVLITVGWVIPHTYNPSDPNAEKNLDKAEAYEKHGIELVGAVAKPANMTDEQFAASKADNLSVAHSGLGLVYFRRQQYDESARELKQSTQAAAHPDPTDLFVLGVDLQSLKLNAEAGDAFDRCAQIPSGLQQQCKSRSDALKQAK